MLFTKAALCLSSLVVLVSAQEPDAASLKGLDVGRTRTPTSTNRLMTRSLDKRCTGSCTECFGAGYTLCPGSSIFCYLPGDEYYGLDSCSSGDTGTGSDSATSTAAASPSSSTSTSTSGGTDICSQVGATCVSCFGSGYMECSDGYHCYNPNDPDYDTCPDDTTGGSDGGSGGTTDSSCAAKWGAGNIACGSTGCYNPDEGEICCEDGYYCAAGTTCSSTVGKCCAAGSTSSGCSGSDGSGLLSSASSFTTTSDFPLTSSSTAGLFGAVASATTTAAGAATTSSVLVDSDPGSGAHAVNVGKGFLVVAGVGALVL
ncbi:hypothetical protein PV08_00519 [Exophiala spinifera]|uniref:Uncharacterized protein n=1 Tax=Exophiala spinifera TaxID=91928 RepID=A0A0D2C8S4_9EURO|nr:uncharacterized protein PV08_00519 [Exophiala spinifera]KIW19944.1 hypothetical protein PV08_00519 [Exophiala spinifera]